MYSTPLWATLPFFILLASIAVVPLINSNWWGKNYYYVSIGLGLLTLGYYFVYLGAPDPVFHSVIDYISFITLIGSLYVIAGGIHIRLLGRARPLANVAFLAIGALIANLVGTTGASMILIRPFIRVNRYRIKPFHIVFFIFIVSNVGGALTPIGDPPLFIGYLKGIPFFWSLENLWYIWLFGVALILVIFYFFDQLDYLKLSKTKQSATEAIGERGEVTGLHNIFFLLLVLIAVFITNPQFLREVIMITAALGSYFSTNKNIHNKNEFDFIPIKEVAVLFIGIFITMVPALEWIRENSANLGFSHAGQYYFATGALSSVLDNTPTYLNFLSAAIGQFVNTGSVQQISSLIQLHGANITSFGNNYAADISATIGTLAGYHANLIAAKSVTIDQISTMYLLTSKAIIVQAISIGAVFFGAMTYIGNGPNLMVKSIAEQSGVKCPSFMSYVLFFSLPVLLPIFFIVWYLFFS
jgi:Na+/H+ antiporter NhaD/arsenite permease-like protein